MMEKAPRLALFINERPVKADTVLILPTNAPYEVRPVIRNNGNLSAADAFVMIRVHTWASNLIHAPKWFVESVGSLGYTNAAMEKIVQIADKVIPAKFEANFQPFWLDTNRTQVFCGFVTYGATGAETERARLHLVFTNGPGRTDVLYDKEAQTFLSRYGQQFDNPTGGDIEFGLLVLRLEDTNEVRIIERSFGGIIRTNHSQSAPQE